MRLRRGYAQYNAMKLLYMSMMLHKGDGAHIWRGEGQVGKEMRSATLKAWHLGRIFESRDIYQTHTARYLGPRVPTSSRTIVQVAGGAMAAVCHLQLPRQAKEATSCDGQSIILRTQPSVLERFQTYGKM